MKKDGEHYRLSIAELERHEIDSATKQAPEERIVKRGRPRKGEDNHALLTTRILNIVKSNGGAIRRRDLVDRLVHDEKWCVTNTADRRISQLRNDGSLIIVRYKDFRQYGIKEYDRGASYVVMKERKEMQER